MAEKSEMTDKHVAAAAIEAAFQKVRQRGDPRTQIERREKQREQNEREAGHPLEVAEHQAELVGRFREADEMDGGYVRREHRQTDDRPRQGIACQKIMPTLAAVFAFAPQKARRDAQTDHSN